MTDNKELIWVSAEFAEEYKQLDSVEAQERAVKKIIQDKQLDLDREQELLSENLLQFKSVCLVHRKELQKVYQEQADTLYTLWEDMGDVTSEIGEHARKVADIILPLKNEVQSLAKQVSQLKKEISELHLYIPEQLVTLTLQVASMDEKTKILLRNLLNMDSSA